ncbi:general substrate transporter [Cadophora sp. DSE1049]|nr:general substrate transporter [Cadophora sp. DSE1049]
MASTPDWLRVQPEHKWSILRLQWRFALWALWTAVGGIMTGFDWGVSGNAAAIPAFQRQFGVTHPTAADKFIIPAWMLTAWGSASCAGDLLGILCAGFLIDAIGRKHTLAVGSVLTAAGVAMQVASHEWKLFLAGRVINALGFGIAYINSPVWIGENVRPELRGFFLCIMNISIVIGQFLLATVCEGIYKIEGEWGYRILIILQFAFVVPLAVGYIWFPESPYYLLKKGRREQARKCLNKIHGSNDQALIDAEMIRIQEDVTFSEQIKVAAHEGGHPYIKAFRGQNRRRTLIALMPALQQQLLGSTFILGFISYFMSLLGIKNFFLVTVILMVVMILSAMAGFFLIEAVGRRKLIVGGTYVLTTMLLVMGICGCFDSQAALWVFLVAVFIWGAVYQGTLGNAAFALGAEVPSLPMRPTTVSLMGFVQMAGVWVVATVSPYLINPDAANLGAKVSFIFFGLSCPICVIMWFYTPETKGLRFEEIDWLFANKVSCRRFTAAIKEHRAQNSGAMIVEGDTLFMLKAEGKNVQHIETAQV